MRTAMTSTRVMVAMIATALAAATIGCSPGRPASHGQTPATPATPSAYAPAATPTLEEAAGATLSISSPVSGETVTAPVPIRYKIHGVAVGPGMHLHAYVDSSAASPIEIPLRGPSGTALLPSHPLLGGRRDLILQLARADHSPVESPGTRVVLHDLIIEGERVG